MQNLNRFSVDNSCLGINRFLFTNNRWRVFRIVSSTIRALLLLSAFCLFAVCLSSPVWAAAIDLRSVSVPDLSRVVLREMLKVDYILSPEVLTSESKVSLSLSNQSKETIIETVKTTLAISGFTMSKRGEVFYISKSLPQQTTSASSGQGVADASPSEKKTSEKHIPDDATFYTYKSKARPLAYLAKLAKFAGGEVTEGDMSGDVLVFMASKPIKERIEAIFRVVDVPVQAVTIRAALIEYSDTSDKGTSFGLSVLSKNLSATFKAGASLANSISFTGATLQAALSAIEGDSRFSYLSRPMLRVLDGQSARISVGSDVPVRGAVTYDKNGNSLQSVEYHSSGVILDVTPKIIGDLITLKVDQQISSFGATTTSNIDSPSLFKRQATTTIDIRRGQLVVMAGLDEDKDTETRSGLSFLPDWSWSNSQNKVKSQILLLIEVPQEDAKT